MIVPCVKVDGRGLGMHLAVLAWVALRTFSGTLIVLTLAGVVLAALSGYVLSEFPWYYGAIAAAVALAEAVTTGFVLGAKRAAVLTLAHALGTLRLGRLLVRVIFERMLGMVASAEFGERGGRIAQGIERLPLAQADELLSGAVRDVTGDAAQASWLRRKIQAALFELIRRYTLARFRDEGAKHGGVNLVTVQKELEETVDAALVRKVLQGLRLWTILVIVGLPFIVAMQTGIILILLHAKG